MKILDKHFTKVAVQIVSWVILVSVWLAALFSSEGHHIAVPEASTWLPAVSEAAVNVVTFITWAFAILSILTLIAQNDDKYIPNTAIKMIEQNGIHDTMEALKHKKYRFFFISIPTFFLMLTIPWYATATVWMLTYAVLYHVSTKQREYIEEKYLSDHSDEKTDTASNM